MFNVNNWRAGKGRGTKIESNEKGRGNHKKSDVPEGARGMVAEQFDRRIILFFFFFISVLDKWFA